MDMMPKYRNFWLAPSTWIMEMVPCGPVETCLKQKFVKIKKGADLDDPACGNHNN
jgi:hypothetical protein